MSRAVLACALALAVPALAATKFTAVPPIDAKAPSTGLELRVVSYDGATNGVLTVEVKNPTAHAADFSPAGLYFVPAVNPDQAPQRLGAVGSTMQSIAPGATVQVKLNVYCIDSHRSSPTSQTPFRLAKNRIPATLTNTITAEAQAETAAMGGIAAPPAKPAVQSVVWKNRDAKWIRLDGEGKQEANK